MARPTKLTPDLHQRIVQYVRAGNFRSTAAAAAGISPVTLRDWLRRGARGEEPYALFREDVDQAEAMAEARDVTLIAKAAEHEWKAAAWRLERKAGRKWGRKEYKPREKVEPTHTDVAEAVEFLKWRAQQTAPKAQSGDDDAGQGDKSP